MEISSDGQVVLAKLYGSVNPHGLVPLPGFLGVKQVPNSLFVHE